jgi:Domain of unknown function (DUF4157)
MAPPFAAVQPCRPGEPSRVIQGFFRGGQPRILERASALARPQPAPVVTRPASVQSAVAPGRPSVVPLAARTRAVQPAARPQPTLPNGARPGAIQPFAFGRPAATQAILPNPPAAVALRPESVQLSGGAQAFAVPATLNLSIAGGGQRLPETVQRKMESFFGASFADVRVHVGAQAPSIGALAFTHGSNLYFAPGQYNPGTLEGQRLLGHELAHVVQQRAGRVRNPFGSGVTVVHDRGLEAEADRMGLHAASHQVTVQAKAAVIKPLSPPVVQRAATATAPAAPAAVVTTWLTAADLKDSVIKEFTAWNKTVDYPTGVTGQTSNKKTVQTHSASKADYDAALTLIATAVTPLGYFVKGDGFSRGEGFLAADIIISKDQRHGKSEPKLIFHLWTGALCKFTR